MENRILAPRLITWSLRGTNRTISSLFLTGLLILAILLQTMNIPYPTTAYSLTESANHSTTWDAMTSGIFGSRKAVSYAPQVSQEPASWDFGRLDEFGEFVSVDTDSAELVIGVQDLPSERRELLMMLINKHGGVIVNRVSSGETVKAIVADIPLSSVVSFVDETYSVVSPQYIEPNIKFRVTMVPNDEFWNVQWGPRKIEANAAWDITVGSFSILVAVVDTGIDWGHPDLQANYAALGVDWVNLDLNPMDDEGHGTHVAGIIAASINNVEGIAGLAQVSLMAEKALDSNGDGENDDLANAIYHAVDMGADIINMSWGSYNRSSTIYDAIKYAYDNDVLLVAAAGNDATSNIMYPAGFYEVMAVTATDENDVDASFSNYGYWVEVSAPGVDIYSTYPGFLGGYAYLDGTSMAAPFVTGVAALAWSRFPQLTRDQVRLWLDATVDDLGTPGFDVLFGFGRVNARRVVTPVVAPPRPPPGGLVGPKADTLNIKIYESDVAEFAAFEAGEIDIVDWPLDPTLVEQYYQLPYNESIVLNFYEEFGMFAFEINNNASIPSYPGVIQPTSDPWFRVAMQYLVDKDFIVMNILQGYGVRTDSPVSPAFGSWYDSNVNHYGYNPAEASTILDAHGYTWGTTWRINPATGVDMGPLIFYVRADDALRRTPAGLYFAAELEAAGIPVDVRIADRSICSFYVHGVNDYNIYTGGGTVDSDGLFFSYHSSQYVGPYSTNYNHVNDALYDYYSYIVHIAPDIPTAMTNAYLAQKRLMNRPDDPTPGISALIPLWCTAGYTAYRHPLVNAVNQEGYGTTNWWTFAVGRFMASDVGGTIRWGFKSDVQQLNPLYSQWVWDWYVLGEIYDGMMVYNPYNVAQDQPWVASSWEVSTWGTGETLLTFTMNDGITFHDGTPLTVNDVKFTIDYIRNYTDCWLYSNVADVDHVDVDPVQRKVYVYENVLSVWALYWISWLPILPKHLWQSIGNPHGFSPEPTLTGSGIYTFTEYVPGDHLTLSANRNYFMPTHPSSDLNFDMVTDIFDIINVAAAFGKERGEAGFNIIADVAADWDIVDIFDLIVVAANFGRVWAPDS